MTGIARRRTAAPIAILTDFGYRDHYVGVMKGVIASIAPAAAIIDISHGIPPQDVVAGSISLQQSRRYFPPKTIFLAVVDPGVGTSRLPIAIETDDGARFVGPDNGLMAAAAEAAGIRRVVELRSPRYRLPELSSTFHGRDIFAPAAAWLACGIPLGRLGPKLASIERLKVPAPVSLAREMRGEVIYIDAFGNLVTNIGRSHYDRFAARYRGCRLLVTINRRAPLELRSAYGEVKTGAPLATFGSFDLLEIAVRDGNAADFFKARPQTAISVRPQRSTRV